MATWKKNVSRNDLGLTKSHQGGIYVLRKDLSFFPQIDTNEDTDNSEITVIDIDDNKHLWQLRWYQSKHELHITHCQKYLRVQGVAAGDTVGLENLEDGRYRLVLEGEGYSSNAEKRIEETLSDFADGKSNLGQGFLSDSAVKKAIENHAMVRAKAYFEKKGYTVRDVSSNNPFDLRCEKEEEVLIIEVKGTTTDGKKVFLTKNEVKEFRKQYPATSLVIVCGIKYQKTGENVKTKYGRINVYQPWKPEDKDLEATQFSYTPN